MRHQCGRRGSRIYRSHHADRWNGDPTPGTKEIRTRLERDTQTKAELQAATKTMHAAWERLKTHTRDAQLRRDVRKVCKWLKRVQSAAIVRYFERHVVEVEKQLRMGDQHWFF